MAKNIFYGVSALVVIVIAFFVYKKFFAKTADSEKILIDEDLEEEKQVAITEREVAVEKVLDQSKKDEAYELAVDIYKDMRGINAHDMDPYLKLYNMPDDQFFYFMVTAYPQVDSNSFLERVEKQNFKVVKKAKVGVFGVIPAVWLVAQLFEGKWTSGAAIQLIANLKKRIKNFKI